MLLTGLSMEFFTQKSKPFSQADHITQISFMWQQLQDW